MLSILDKLPLKEKEIFKQVIMSYDEKNFKKASKLLKKALSLNPNFTGCLTRVFINESALELPHPIKHEFR